MARGASRHRKTGIARDLGSTPSPSSPSSSDVALGTGGLIVLAASAILSLSLWHFGLQDTAAASDNPAMPNQATQKTAQLPLPPDKSSTRFSVARGNRCNIQVAPNFLSSGEVSYLLELIQRTGGWEASRTGGAQFEVPAGADSGDFPRTVNRDPVVHRIEKRIAEATGIPIHTDEDMLSFARIRSRGKDIRGGHFPPFGLHHESDTRPNRARTILVYLDAATSGGRTIFPLCGTPAADPVIMERRRLFEHALGEQWGERATGYRRHVGIDPKMDHPFNEFLTDVCESRDGYASTPEVGTAIMWDSTSRGTNEPYNLTWHAGCNVVDGTKIILQKFKELPFPERPSEYAGYRRKEYMPYRPTQ